MDEGQGRGEVPPAGGEREVPRYVPVEVEIWGTRVPIMTDSEVLQGAKRAVKSLEASRQARCCSSQATLSLEERYLE